MSLLKENKLTLDIGDRHSSDAISHRKVKRKYIAITTARAISYKFMGRTKITAQQYLISCRIN